MPAARYYEVEQTRVVKVTASSPTDAMLLASVEFAKAQPVLEPIPNEEVQGRVTSDVEVTRIEIHKEF